jgi:hypothetical protein
MKSSILIVSYLWKDTWSRWLEQPSSFLARVFVGALLVSVATLILVALSVMERTLRERLENFGLNTLVIRNMVVGTDPELLLASSGPDRLAPLQTQGQSLRLRQLFMRGRTDWQNNVLVMSYAPESLAALGSWMSEETPLICFSDTLPPGAMVQVQVDRLSGWAVVRRPGDRLRPLINETVILAPQGWAREVERGGYVDITLFERHPDALPMADLVHAVQQVYTLDRRTPPQIQSSLQLIEELEVLQETQTKWRAGLALGLGLTIALVFGTIAVLEFRQNMYIGALLRSMGVPGRYLYLRQWAENTLLANGAAVAALLVLSFFHVSLFSTLGFEAAGARDKYEIFWGTETAFILICVNAGAFLSSLPVAVGLRRPVGTILS